MILPLTAIVSIVGSGCGHERELREWTPEDHQPPPTGDDTGSGRAAPAADSDPEATLFGSRCATCHGRDGRGHGPAAPPNVPDFTVASFQSERTDEAIARVIGEGRGLMPAFGEELTEAGIAAMVRYVRRLGASAAPAPIVAPDPGVDPAVAPAGDPAVAPGAAPAPDGDPAEAP